LLVAASAALAAGCGEKTHHAAMRPPPTYKPSSVPRGVKIAVFDGDLGRPIAQARVQLGRLAARTNRHGVAVLRPRHRRLLPLRISASGYDGRQLHVNVRHRPLAGVRIFRRSLQWTMFGANDARTQTQPRIHVDPPFRVVWSRPLGGLLEFPAVVTDGVAYVGNAWGSVRGFSMANGTLAWRFDIPHGKLASSPAIVGDELIVHGMDGHVWVFDRHNGRLLWHRWIGAAIESSPLVWHGLDFFGAWSGNVYALDLSTHRVRWVYHAGYKITSSASRRGNTIFIGDYGGRLLALSARTGRRQWAGSVNGRIYGTPAVSGGRVFVPSSDGDTMNAFSVRGRKLWTVHTGAYVYSSPAVWGGRVFFGSHNGFLYCVSVANGRVLWRYSSGAPISGAPSVVGNIVYFSNLRNGIFGLKARTGRRVFRFPDGQYVPVSGNGGKLLLHGYSRLYAVEHRRR
jgi:outer membrane protein assembly factor BamB